MTEPLKLITQAESWKANTQHNTIELLEEWLTRAKAGEIVAVALAGERVDGFVLTHFTRPAHRATMIGALAHLQHMLHCDMDNG